jgi:hypothetical protein
MGVNHLEVRLQVARSVTLCLFIGFCAWAVRAEEPSEPTRPITEADSVLAVYREDWGRASSGGPAIILVAWPDGHIVWSSDRIQGGAPYRAGRVDPKRVAALLVRSENDGLFADEKLNQAHFGPDSQFITLLVKSGKKQVKMQSWHELFEGSDKVVVDHRGAVALEGRRRLDELRKAPAEYLFFRTVWSETRTRLSDLIPVESDVSTGKPVMKVGVVSWQERAATSNPSGGNGPSKK